MTNDEEWRRLRVLTEKYAALVREWRSIPLSAPYQELQRKFQLQDESDELRREINRVRQELGFP